MIETTNGAGTMTDAEFFQTVTAELAALEAAGQVYFPGESDSAYGNTQ